MSFLAGLFKSEMRKQYILSFMFVFSIPVIIIISFMYFPILNLLRAEEISKDAANSQVIRDTMDIRMAEISNLAVQVNSDMRIKEFLYREYPLDNKGIYVSKDISSLIESYEAGNSFISMMAIYFNRSSSVITKSGKYDAGYFFQYVLNYQDMGIDEVAAMMNRPQYNTFLPVKEIKGTGSLNGRYVTYIQTIPIGGDDTFANVVMFISENNLVSSMGEETKNDDKQAVIISKTGETVFSRSDISSLKQQFITNINSGSSYFITENMSSKNTVVSLSASEKSDWVYVVFSNMDDLISQVNDIRKQGMIIALFSFVIIFILSLLMAGFTYKPWIHLNEKMKTIFNTSGNNRECKNEFLLAMDTIDKIKVERDQLHSDINKRQSYIDRFVMQNICEGILPAVDIHPMFPFANYCVIIIDMAEKRQLLSRAALFVQKLAGIYYRRQGQVYTYQDEKGRLNLILNMNSADEKAVVGEINKRKEALERQWNILLFIGIGRLYQDMEKVSVSHTEAIRALEYCFLKGKDSLVFYPDIQHYILSSINLPVNSDNPLLNSVKAGDLKSCRRLLDEYFNNIINAGDFSIQYTYCLFYNFISIIIKACTEINADFNQVFNQSSEQMLDIERYRNAKQLIEYVYQIYGTLCEYIQKNRTCHNAHMKEQIIAYINANYSNKNISLIEAADKLGFSPSYLSRSINQEFGIGFGELLSKARLGVAKTLLAEGGSSISEVADKTGFNSIYSFTRVFKKTEGITPSQYKDLSFSKQ
ncbi:MAG: helix-turn-helix domain-containing protein [Clostridiaceae bacterium]|nr:helix-turn-helix domain-containing protein [Clostridiaceae bacterium]